MAAFMSKLSATACMRTAEALCRSNQLIAQRSNECTGPCMQTASHITTPLGLCRYDNLRTVSEYFPAATNRHGSYLTGFSDGGLQLAVITTLTGYSQMVADQSYWCALAVTQYCETHATWHNMAFSGPACSSWHH